jgi:phosphatidylglycerophosphate synthase
MFRSVTEYGTLFLGVTSLASVATLAFFGLFPLYFPELFPPRVRATGQGLSCHLGRILAVVGVLLQGSLVAAFDGNYARAGAVVTPVYLAGMARIWVVPETRGTPLPA